MRKGYGLLAGLLITCAATAAYAGEDDMAARELKRLDAAASQGDPHAMECAAEMYWIGLGGPRDPEKAAVLLEQLAKTGDKQGVNEHLLLDMYMTKDPRQRAADIARLKEAARQGDPNVQFNLGYLYLQGYSKELPQDTAEALRLVRASAEQDAPYSQALMGSFYAHGWGVKQDAVKAATWTAKAKAHSMGCLPYYALLVYQLIQANIQYQPAVAEGTLAGSVCVRFLSSGGHVKDAAVVVSSGHPELDAAALKAVQDLGGLPPLPSGDLDGVPLALSFYFGPNMVDPGYWSGYVGSIRSAIYDAMVLPKHALIFGTTGTGITGLSFDYQDGKTSNVKVDKPSGDAEVDAAAVATVKSAHYPTTPKGERGRKRHVTLALNYTNQLGLVDASGNALDNGFTDYVTGVYEAFTAEMRAAILRATVYPQQKVAAGETALVPVAFDFKDGVVSGIKVTDPTADPVFAAAAIEAVQQAILPEAPRAYAGKSVHMALQVRFTLSDPAPAAATAAVPGTGSGIR